MLTCNRVSGASELFTAIAGFAGATGSADVVVVDDPPSRDALSLATFSARSRLSACEESAWRRPIGHQSIPQSAP